MTDPAAEPLGKLDFAVESFPCEVARQPWFRTKEFLGRRIRVPFPDVPKIGPCPNPATTVVEWRVCPCIANVKKWKEEHPELLDTHMPQLVWGLCVIRTAMCDSHIEYFVDYLNYPFVCPNCGVGYGSPREMLLDGVDINEG